MRSDVRNEAGEESCRNCARNRSTFYGPLDAIETYLQKEVLLNGLYVLVAANKAVLVPLETDKRREGRKTNK